MENKRIVAFQIPPAIPGIVTTWHGVSYAREDESLVPLPVNKIDLIRSQVGRDWSKEIVSDIEVLNKAGLTFKGQITRTALRLLGKKESSFY